MRLSCVFSLVGAVLAGWGGLTGRGWAAEPQPVLVKDIHVGTDSSGLSPKRHVAAGGRVFMAGFDGEHGEELWVSDGTETGTRRVKDIWPGRESSSIKELMAAGSRVFFKADDGVHGQELWVSDGTEAGTRMVIDLRPGTTEENLVRDLVPLGSGVIFRTGRDYLSENKLWYSDGTEAGTRLLKAVSLQEAVPQSRLTQDMGGAVYAFLRTGPIPEGSSAPGQALWRTDGTVAGTMSLTDVPALSCEMLGVVGQTLYFLAWVGPSQSAYELWKTDGTGAGTVRVKSLTLSDRRGEAMPKLVAAGGKGYISVSYMPAGTYTSITDLWETDGTEAGTRRVTDIPAAQMPAGHDVIFLEGLGMGTRVVAALGSRAEYGKGLIWVYDPATQTSTSPSRGVALAAGRAQALLGMADRLFFITSPTGAPGDNSERKLWMSEGAEGDAQGPLAGTDTVRIIGGLSPLGTEVLFQGESAAGEELWKSDGSVAGTVRLTDLGTTRSSRPMRFFQHEGLTYFSADDGGHGRELWCTDGTAAGTRMVQDIALGVAHASPHQMVSAGGWMYFQAWRGSSRYLYRTDGTAERTFSIDSLDTSESLTAAGSDVFYTNLGWLHRRGAEGVTRYTEWNAPASLTALDGSLYFIGRHQSYGWGLYCVAGPYTWPEKVTGGGFSVLEDTPVTVARPPVPGAAVAPDKHVLYLTQDHQLWRCCNGESPVLVYAFPHTRYKIEKLMLQGDQILMEVASHPNSLWRSDGTAAGTVPFPVANGKARLMRAVGETVYFQSLDQTQTPAGLCAMNRDGSDVRELVASNNLSFMPLHAEGETLFLARYSYADSAWTLWRTEGTPETTVQVSPLPLAINLPGTATFKTPSAAVGPDHRLYLPVNSGLYGDELYALDLNGRLEVTEQAGAQGHAGRELASGDAVIFPQERVGHQAETRRLRVRNAGYRVLTGFSLGLGEGDDFEASFIAPASGTLAPGEEIDVTVTFAPKAGGARSRTLQILATGSEAVTHAVTLTGTGFGLDQAPELRASPASRLLLPGETLTLTPEIYTAAAFTSLVWKKDNQALASTGTDGELTYAKTGVQKGDVGLYTLTATTAAGTVTTAPAVVGVLAATAVTSLMNEGGALTLQTGGTVPKGYRLEYQWRRDGQALMDTKVLKGSRSAVLKISRAELTDEGAYDCWVTLATTAGPVMVEEMPVSYSTGAVQVMLQPRPRVQMPAEPLRWMIGEAVSYQLITDVPATSFTAKGLPPGLKMSKTGLITGNPTRSLNSDAAGAFLPFQVTITATNAVGTGPAQVVPMQVHAFIPAGGYDCLLDPIDGLTHGSHLKFTVSSTGALSGQLLHGGKTYRFTSRQLQAAAIPGSHYEFHLGTKALPLKLVLVDPEMEGQGQPWVATLAQGEGGVQGNLQADCRRHLFSSAQPATALMGAYTWSFDAPGHEESPPGSGFMTATVAKTGLVTWRGKLADGTAVMGSNALSALPGGGVDLPVHVDLYKLQGALHGAAVFGAEEAAVTLSGGFFWDKNALPETSKERAYRYGFDRHEVAIEGSRYQAPATGEYLFGIEASGVNAQAFLSGPELDLELTQDIALSVKHTATLPAPTLTNGCFLKSLTLTAKTGTFKGSVLVLHPTEPKLNRLAAFEGVILSDAQVARGFVLLPQLPPRGDPASAMKTMPLKSAQVMLQALPGE